MDTQRKAELLRSCRRAHRGSRLQHGGHTLSTHTVTGEPINPTEIHVYPENDLIEHDVETPRCLCGPRLEIQPSGDQIYVHHSLDGRERNEPAWRYRP